MHNIPATQKGRGRPIRSSLLLCLVCEDSTLKNYFPDLFGIYNFIESKTERALRGKQENADL